jgi:hypothetical protein
MNELPKTNAKMPTPQMPQVRTNVPNPKPPGPAVNHPAVAEYITQFNWMATELDRLNNENKQLKYDRDVDRRTIQELQHISDHERMEKEKFQRWAVRFDTMVGEIAALANQVRDESSRASASSQPQQIEEHGPPLNEELDASIADIAKKFAPKSV